MLATAGVPILKALQAAADTLSNTALKRDAQEALVLVRDACDPQPVIADGLWHGEIVEPPRGEGGFGYDPHFLLPELGRTAAELDAATKNRVSHRGLAMRELLAKLAHARLLPAARVH
jgi:XTP/dITP diphosphohydrolase